MLEYSDYYDFIYIDKKSISDIEKKGFVHRTNIFSIHFNRLRNYNPSWKLDKIIAFERFMFLSKKYGHNTFTQKYPDLLKFIRCSTVRLGTIISELEQEGYLAVEKSKKKGVSQLNIYKVNFNNILSSIKEIYNFEEITEDEEDLIEIMKEFINYHASSGYKKSEKPTIAPKSDEISDDDFYI